MSRTDDGKKKVAKQQNPVMNTTSTSRNSIEMADSPADLGPAPHLPFSQICLMVFSYISVFLYVWIVIVIIKYRKKYSSLQSPFYHLLMIQAFTDLMVFLVFEIILRPRKYRYFALPIFTFYPRFSFFCSLTSRSAMFLGYVPFALNRFTIFFRPTLYKQIWNRRTTTLCAVLQWLIPLLFNGYAFFVVDSTVYFNLLPNGVLQLLADSYIAYVDTLQGFIVEAVVTLTCVALYVWTFRRAKQHTLPPQIAKAEFRLLICSTVTFIPMILDSVRNVGQIVCEHIFGYRTAFVISAELLYFSIEIASVAQPWAILLTNETIRKLLLGEERMQRSSIGMSTTSKPRDFVSVKNSPVSTFMKKTDTVAAVSVEGF